jgi:hypothetical protein|nr:MAG TPA: hypothetical protein [Caudoviricetes sp.]
MRTLAKLLWLVVLAPPLLVGLSIGFIGLILEKEETYQ